MALPSLECQNCCFVFTFFSMLLYIHFSESQSLFSQIKYLLYNALCKVYQHWKNLNIFSKYTKAVHITQCWYQDKAMKLLKVEISINFTKLLKFLFKFLTAF